MKNKKLIYDSLRYAFLVSLGLLFSSYGNERSHRSINQYIVESFVNRYSKFEANLPRFKNYVFNFDKGTFSGDYISHSGLFHAEDYAKFIQEQSSYYEEFKKRLAINASDAAEYFDFQHPTYEEKRGNKTAKDWIIHGGYSADVPEVHASLRHFYDPTKPANKRYLTDEANNAVMKKLQSYLSNPEINGVDWALGDQSGLGVTEHNYSWESGKKYIQGALEEPDPDKRNKYMAKAWRSLGETLHMIADNGCPPHVRNDAHPLGNVDTYEEMVEQMNISQFKNGSVPGYMKNKFNDKNMTARKIAHELAVFTNENFFSNETISGTDRKGNKIIPVAHPSDKYSSPKISKSDYIFRDQCYHKKIGNEKIDVLMCTDKFYFWQYNITSYYPYIDEACVKSQANVLIPTIIEAGTNVMKWFIPELKIVINSIDDQGNIDGEIAHKTDNEYKNKINYNGPVYIQTITFEDQITLTAKNGKFNGKINVSNSPFFAQIEFGGIQVRSENINMVKANPKKVGIVKLKIDPLIKSSGGHLSLFNNYSIFTNFEIQTNGTLNNEHNTSKATLNKTSLTVNSVYENAGKYSKSTTKTSAKVLFDDKRTMIISLIMTLDESITFNLNDPDNISVESFINTIELQNIPISVESDGDVHFYLTPDDKQANLKKAIKELVHQEIKTSHGETKTKTSTKDNLNDIRGISFSIDFDPN